MRFTFVHPTLFGSFIPQYLGHLYPKILAIYTPIFAAFIPSGHKEWTSESWQQPSGPGMKWLWSRME